MELLPPVGMRELATKSDVADLRAATKADIADLRAATKADIADVRVELRDEIAGVRVELAGLRAEIAELGGGLRSEMYQNFTRVYETITAQTRTLTLAMVGTSVSGITLAFAAARFA